MMTKYLNMALIFALVVAAGVTKYYTPSDAQQVAAAQVESAGQLAN